jgi:hypothetical protein
LNLDARDDTGCRLSLSKSESEFIPVDQPGHWMTQSRRSSLSKKESEFIPVEEWDPGGMNVVHRRRKSESEFIP